MSLIQRVFKAVLPRSLVDSMEADSRRWHLQCSACGHEISVWDLGGIRWKAKGESRNYGKCRACGKRNWHRMIFKPEQ